MISEAEFLYGEALHRGIAKEQARALLPEGLTPSRLYVNGTMRSWITFLQARLDPSTQKEHRLVAQDVLSVLRGVAPVTMDAFFGEQQ
jgi:thymidylate synthase (FAD)